MRKVKFLILVVSKFIKRNTAILGIASAAIFLLVIFFLKFHSSFFKSYISEGSVGTYTQDDLPPQITNLVSEGLVKIDSSGKAVPDLVTGWQVNNDATSYTLKIRDNLRWSDGSLIRAQDIALGLKDAQISTPDDRTIQIKLADSYSFLPELLDKPIFKTGSNIGTGPYQIDQIQKDKTNNTFINRVDLSSPDVKLPNITVRFYSSEDLAIEALKLGKIQSLEGVNNPSVFSSENPFSTLSEPNYAKLVTIFYNTKDPILSDKNFRLALSYAAPSIMGEAAATTSFPASFWAFNPSVKNFLNNPTEAKNSLSKVKNGADSVISLTTIAPLESVGQRVVSSWVENGIKADLRIESGIPQNFQALLITQDIPLDPDQYSLWHSTQKQTNVSHYDSSSSQFAARVDKDLEDGRKILDFDARKAAYQDFQKVLLDDSPATFLYFPKFNVIYQKKVKDNLLPVLKLQFPNINFK